MRTLPLSFPRKKAFESSLSKQQWKVLSQEVKFTKKALDTRSMVRERRIQYPFNREHNALD